MMNRKYNDQFISEFNEEDYVKCLKTVNYLDILRNNYNGRYDDNYSKFDGTVNLFKESLDHYVLLKMEKDANFINTLECNNYFNYLRKLSNGNSYEFYTNVVLYNVLYNTKYSNYFNKYIGSNGKTFSEKNKVNSVRINGIYNKIRNKQSVSQVELDLICGFVSDYREKSKMMEDVIKYIFNNLTNQKSDLRCSIQVVSAILSYMPYNCDAIKKNGFNPADVRMFAADRYYNGREYKGMGQSSYKYRQVILPRRIAKNTNFKSIAASSNPFSFKEYFKNGDYSFTLMLMIAYHEITHQYQMYMSKLPQGESFINYDFFKEGLPMAISNILDDKLKDYRENHDNDDIEIHATQCAWDMCHNFYNSVLLNGNFKNELLRRCSKNKNGTLTRYSFTVKKDKNGNLIDADKYNIDSVSKIMKDEKNREKYFNEIPYLKYIFRNDGRFKIDILFINNFGYTRFGAGLLENLINTKGIDNKIINNVKNKSRDMINIATSNIYMGIRYSCTKLYHLEWYTAKDFNDDFKVNSTFLDVASSILDEQVNVINNGKRLLHQVFNCHDFDDLIESQRKKSIEYYKKIKENVNKSNNLGNKGIRR